MQVDWDVVIFASIRCEEPPPYMQAGWRVHAHSDALVASHTVTQLQVKVRSVGVNGAGHSPWSKPVAVTVSGHLEHPPPPPASTASETSEAPKRRRKKAAHDRELQQADPKRSEQPKLASLLSMYMRCRAVGHLTPTC